MKPRDIVIILILLILGILFFIATNYKNIKPNFGNSVNQNETSYTCPKTEYLDCMPSVGSNNSGVKKLCNDQRFLDWAQNNCPNFKGVAY